MSVSKVFVARLANCGVFDPDGLRIGKVRDVIVVFRAEHAPRVAGLAVEVPGKRQIFVPIQQVTSIGSSQIIADGVIDLRRFAQRGEEVRVLGEIIGRRVTFRDGALPNAAGAPGAGTIDDVSIEQDEAGEWSIGQLYLRLPRKGASFFGKAPSRYATWDEVDVDLELEGDQSATAFLTAHSEMRPSDLAATLLELPRDRMFEVAAELPDERLADVLEEMYEDDQVAIIEHLDDEHAADVLDRMQPDDAADLVAKLGPERSEHLLELMEPEEAEDVRMLLEFAPNTAGGLMTTDPVIVSQDTSIAEALAIIRRKELPAALATTVFVTMSPYEPPTGRFLGIVHFQRMLRHPPHETVGTIMDRTTEPVTTETPDSEVSRVLASYDLMALPVVDDEHRLVGVITVDDVLDHILPADWRSADAPSPATAPRLVGRATTGATAAQPPTQRGGEHGRR